MASSAPHTEHEVKLRPGPDVDLAKLADLGGLGTDPATLEPLGLVATYYDTPACTLAAEGITVRHRTGEPPDRWTVKLPVGSGGPDLVRSEIDVEGPSDHIPPEVLQLLAAHLRGRPLSPLAVIRTTRSRVVVRDEAGRDLVEVAHDVVTAARVGFATTSWQEIEVEALDREHGDAALRHTVDVLRQAGCQEAPATPKLVRALGEDAAQLVPEASSSVLPSKPRPQEALVHAVTRSVRQILDHDPRVRLGGDPEDLHQLRVAVRRLRSDIALLAGSLDDAEIDRLTAELAWLVDETNAARDLDVLGAWLEETGARLDDVDGQGFADLVQRCQAQQADQRAAVLDVLASSRYLDLVDELVGLTVAPAPMDRAEQKALHRQLRHELRRRWRRLDKRVHKLAERGDDRSLHRARIATKRCRAAAEASAPIDGRAIHHLARSLAHLQDVLGAAHDASVMEAWLRDAAASSPSTAFVAGELAATARDDARREQERWPKVWAKARRRARSGGL